MREQPAACKRKQDEAFAQIAQHLRDRMGTLYNVHVYTNDHRITLVERGYVGGCEADITLHVKRIP